MILPTQNTALNNNIEFVENTTHTFFLDIYDKRSYGYTDGQKAMEQAIYLILQTERYRHVIFSWNYGVELEDLFGMPLSWVIPEVKRRIEEALLHDTRIKAVDDFSFEADGNKLMVRFTAHTVFGDVRAEKGVDF